jgi:Ca-activated chloride channel family protein
MNATTRQNPVRCAPRLSASRLFVLAGTTIATALILLASRAAPAVQAAQSTPGTGALVGRDESGHTIDFPLKHTDVQIDVSGFLARAQVTQEFTNPYNRRIEAVYVFPLPENAAVDDMVMKVGTRTIRGVIRERGEARQVYEQARANGQTAALLEQERPNIFTQSVANLLPGDDVKITLTYVQTIKYEAGTLSLSFPMVVGPRYIPGHVTTPDGDAIPVDDRASVVPDADCITPPVLRPGTRSGHDVSLSVHLDAGVPYTDLRSKSHEIQDRRIGPNEAEVRLAASDGIPNRDFVLQWDVRPDHVAAGVLAHRTQADGFVTLMLVPSPSPRDADVTPKEVVFVLDCSGSMSGAPIEAAKSLVRHALGNLNRDDTFKILSFSMSASGLSPNALRNTPENIARGLAYLNGLQGEGGTEMITGVRAALSGGGDPRRLRVVLFLTDGYIGNETEILSAVRDHVGDTRLYSLGVGTAVNRYLLENLAQEGRGQVLYIQPGENPTAAVARFYDQVRSPVLTNIAIDWNGLEVQQAYPANPTDLFAGHPLQVTARYHAAGDATIHVTGRIAGERVSIPVQVSLPARETRNPALKSLWARQAIDELMRKMLQGEIPEIVKEIIRISVANRVMSRYTAFVAVEEKTRTDEKGAPTRIEVPVEMPKDVSFEGVFGEDSVEVGLAAPQAAAMMATAKAKRSIRSFGFSASAPPAPASAAATYAGSFAVSGRNAGAAASGATRSAQSSGYGGGSAVGSLADGQVARMKDSGTSSSAMADAEGTSHKEPGLRPLAGDNRPVAVEKKESSDTKAGPTVEVRVSKGIAGPAMHAFKSRVWVTMKALAANLAGITTTLRVAADNQGRLRVTAIEGLDREPAKRDRIRRALQALNLWQPSAAAGATGTAELVVAF